MTAVLRGDETRWVVRERGWPDVMEGTGVRWPIDFDSTIDDAHGTRPNSTRRVIPTPQRRVSGSSGTVLDRQSACAMATTSVFGAWRVTVVQGRQCGFRGRRGRVPLLELPLDDSPQPFAPSTDLVPRNSRSLR